MHVKANPTTTSFSQRAPMTNPTQRECRICLDPVDKMIEANSPDVLSPCRCAGSIKWVHRDCLNDWISSSENVDHKKCCDVCK